MAILKGGDNAAAGVAGDASNLSLVAKERLNVFFWRKVLAKHWKCVYS
jgi:hypothetical protein